MADLKAVKQQLRDAQKEVERLEREAILETAYRRADDMINGMFKHATFYEALANMTITEAKVFGSGIANLAEKLLQITDKSRREAREHDMRMVEKRKVAAAKRRERERAVASDAGNVDE